MSNVKFKPCPFCGAKIEDVFPDVSRMRDGDWVVTHYCPSLRRPGGDVGVTIDVYGRTKKQAAELWNTRAGKK